jgi:hypothetical protein
MACSHITEIMSEHAHIMIETAVCSATVSATDNVVLETYARGKGFRELQIENR